MKFLIYGNSPTVGTGYGVQIKHLCHNLLQAGHEVGVACTYGHQVGVRRWPTPYGEVTLFPSGWKENSLDVLIPHAQQFFEGDPKGGWIITCTDQWVLNPLANDLAEFQVIAWTPVDHFPAPTEVLRFLNYSGARSLAMSEFGRKQLQEAGVETDLAPLAVDTSVFKPSPTVAINGEDVPGRELLDIPTTADFVVLMVAMNKDPMDRKNFDGAFRAFGRFWREHQNAVLYVHSDKFGMAGSFLNLMELAKHAAIPPHAIKFSSLYSVQIGWTPEMLAAMYSAADVLLCPSKGEGFCVPMIEAQACGTPVIASDFSAQSELIGPGWGVSGQLLFDQHQNASYLTPFTSEVYTALEHAYADKGNQDRRRKCIEFASRYSVDNVWTDHWEPLLASLEPKTPKADKPKMTKVAVLVPAMQRPQNVARLTSSFATSTPVGAASLYYILDEDDTEQIRAVELAGAKWLPAKRGSTYAQKMNAGFEATDEDWLFLAGDDVEFTDGWLLAARALSDTYDVIGTNDSEPGRVRNPLVAKGSHADHFFVRRSYVDDEGASLDGPGILTPEVYGHWYVDREIIELAKARGVFTPCLDSVVIHHHPGYDGNEDAREGDAAYMKAVAASEKDHRTWMQRAPIVAGYRSR